MYVHECMSICGMVFWLELVNSIQPLGSLYHNNYPNILVRQWACCRLLKCLVVHPMNKEHYFVHISCQPFTLFYAYPIISVRRPVQSMLYI